MDAFPGGNDFTFASVLVAASLVATTFWRFSSATSEATVWVDAHLEDGGAPRPLARNDLICPVAVLKAEMTSFLLPWKPLTTSNSSEMAEMTAGLCVF